MFFKAAFNPRNVSQLLAIPHLGAYGLKNVSNQKCFSIKFCISYFNFESIFGSFKISKLVGLKTSRSYEQVDASSTFGCCKRILKIPPQKR
ncbi:hypothetical protein L596_025113 [Steinernema carpocapsae]|uniref:Uncharacterized protein n=1 Tax=Steinernema carpocapsae TaxID=34508 RepID=A0A4U5M6X1_STECR|nr:hypothetical protein L596_025113 [Steinernema carpocapsae]